MQYKIVNKIGIEIKNNFNLGFKLQISSNNPVKKINVIENKSKCEKLKYKRMFYHMQQQELKTEEKE